MSKEDIFDRVVAKRTNGKSLSKLRACVLDYGFFLSHAERLAQDFKEVYFVPLGWKGEFPDVEKSLIGEGRPGITVVPDFYDIKRELDPENDLIAFFDVGEGKWAEDLRIEGFKRVFSCGRAERLEMDRWFLKEHMESIGLPVTPFLGGDWEKGKIQGLTNLEKKLQEIEGKADKFWVKISTFRGLRETFPFESMVQVQPYLTEIEGKAGKFADRVKFLIEDHIEAIESGCDVFTSKGLYFPKCLEGWEKKGTGLVGKVVDTQKLSRPLLKVLIEISPYLKKNGAQGMMSTENRITPDGTAYMPDGTLRSGNPPGDLQLTTWRNFPKMVYAAAGGETIMPEETGKYGIQLQLHSGWAESKSMVIEVPEKYAPYVWLRKIAKLDGHNHYIPRSGIDCIGAVVKTGDNLDELWEEVLDIAGQVKGIGIEYDPNLWPDLKKTIAQGEKRGLEKF